MNKLGFINKSGFSLVELVDQDSFIRHPGLCVVPNFILGIRQKAAKKTAIGNFTNSGGGRKYYIDKNSWPADFPTLAAGYLDPTWSATNLNPFGNPYIVSISAPI